MKVVNDLKTRVVEDILIAVVDGLEGFLEAIGAVFAATTVQACIVTSGPQPPGLRELEGPRAA